MEKSKSAPEGGARSQSRKRNRVFAMQEQLLRIFSEIKKMLKEYEPPFSSRIDLDSRYELWSNKEVTIAGRKRKSVHFATIIVQSNYVGFYFMPVYSDSSLKKVFGRDLLSTLKGKSCFHIKKNDPVLLKQTKEAIEKGFKLYKKRKWV